MEANQVTGEPTIVMETRPVDSTPIETAHGRQIVCTIFGRHVSANSWLFSSLFIDFSTNFKNVISRFKHTNVVEQVYRQSQCLSRHSRGID